MSTSKTYGARRQKFTANGTFSLLFPLFNDGIGCISVDIWSKRQIKIPLAFGSTKGFY